MKAVIGRLISMVVTVHIISFVVFMAFSVIPGDPALMLLGGESRSCQSRSPAGDRWD
jgi:peptide/nickel transport system permease protein